MIKLDNGTLEVQIAELGAEIQMIKGKNGIQYIFDDKSIWDGHAPNLFPVIGRLNNYQYHKGDKTYEILQHGFAKLLPFSVVEKSTDHAILELTDTEETFERYPYHFIFRIHYTLSDNHLSVAYEVKNHSTDNMPYSVGGHPAFNVPIGDAGTYDDYEIVLDKPIDVTYHVSQPVPYLNGEVKPFKALSKGKLKLDHEVFRNGLIILDADDINSVTLQSSQTPHQISLDVHEFPYLCLWTKEQMDAPFICIEPFHGLPDIAGEVGTLEEKQGMIILPPNHSNTTTFTMSFK